MSTTFAGVVLAGGQSKRFGSPKAFALRNGIPFYQYSIKALTPLCRSITIVTRRELRHLFDKAGDTVQVIEDDPQIQGQGPLAGICSAMNAVKAEWFIVLPVDVPYIESRVIAKLTDSIDPAFEAIVPVVDETIQPLVAIYHHSAAALVKTKLEADERSMHRLLSAAKVKYIDFEDKRPFMNVNRPKDMFI